MQQEQSQQQAQALFPPPPPFYALYRSDADGSAERPLPPAPPPPPAAGEYTSFAMLHTVESGLPRLQGRQIYTARPDGTIAVREQLLVLHRELMVNILELLTLLVEKPSAYARQVENVMVVFRNMMYLANLLRPHQARTSLLATLQRDLEQRRAATEELRQLSARADEALAVAAARLERAAAAAEVHTGKADGPGPMEADGPAG